MNKKILIPMIIVFALALLGGGYFYWSQKQKTAEAPIQTDDSREINVSDIQETATEDILTDSATKGTLPSIRTNPLEEKPDLNPVDKTNPYKDIKTNPFK